MPAQDCSTVAALLTPNAPGAIAVVGLAGDETPNVLTRLLKQPRDDAPPRLTPRVPVRCRVCDERGVIDDAVVALFHDRTGPRADLCLHGGPRVVQRVLLCLEAAGVMLLDAAPFHRRITTDHPVRLDVDTALLGARSRRLVHWLLKQRDVLPPFLDAWTAHPPHLRESYVRRTQIGIRLVHGLTVALVGPPNSGKSTLANRLIGDERILTSEVPGTTRDWVRETALIDGWPVTLTDTAGVRDTSCAVEEEAIRRGAEQSRAADLVLMVLDVTRPAAQREVERHRTLTLLRPGQPHLVVFNKCDMMDVDRADEGAVVISARTGLGIDQLESHILAALGVNTLFENEPTGFLESHLSMVASDSKQITFTPDKH